MSVKWNCATENQKKRKTSFFFLYFEILKIVYENRASHNTAVDFTLEKP